MTADNAMHNKAKFWEYTQKLSIAVANEKAVLQVLKEYCHENIMTHAMHPINEQQGLPSVYENIWKPFFHAFPDAERVTTILLSGNHKGEEWVSANGYFVATFKNVWLGMNPSNQLITIRYGEYTKFENGKISETYLMFDLLDIMRQIKTWPLGYSFAQEGWWPSPANNKGIVLQSQDLDETKKTVKLHTDWINQLNDFSDDSQQFEDLKAEEFLHPYYMQYATSGFGAVRGLASVHEHFHKPILYALKQRRFGHYQMRMAEGNLFSATGWQSVKARHENKIFGFAASNKPVKVRTMEWWRRVGDKMRESWLMIDTLDLLLQMDIDLYAEMLSTQDQKSWL